MYEGIWYGKSYNQDKGIKTFAETREFEANWIADDIWDKAGIITMDKRVFGNTKNIAKYGCAIGDELDINLRGLQTITQSKLDLKLKEELNKTYSQQQKYTLLLIRSKVYQAIKIIFLILIVIIVKIIVFLLLKLL